jgi:hypothetical protein
MQWMNGIRKTGLLVLVAAIAGALSPASEAQAQGVLEKKAAAQRKASENKGKESFETMFDADVSGYDAENAYILSYLSAVVYADGLQWMVGDFTSSCQGETAKAAELQKNKDNVFETTFRDRLKGFFGASTTFKFVYPLKGNTDGFDPEAMLIETPKALLIVFRGTDRDGNSRGKSGAAKFAYDWSEWIRVDFRAGFSDPGNKIDGKVHEGIWRSMKVERTVDGKTVPFRDELLAAAKAAAAKGKKIWLTGHSLGAGYAQLFAGYLESQSLNVQGIYGYAAPHVADSAFAKWLDSKLEGGKQFQRFEFMTDPITQIGPSPLFGRAGVRNHFTKLNELKRDQKERGWIAFLPNHMCYHHWQWYVNAAFAAMPDASCKKMPNPLALPTLPCIACDQDTMRNALEGDAVVDAIEQAPENIEKLVYKASKLIENVRDNLDGKVVADGDYHIRSVAGAKRYLAIDFNDYKSDEDGGVVLLAEMGKTEKNKTFRIRHEGPGYLIECAGNRIEQDANDLFKKVGRVQSWTPLSLPFVGKAVPQQTWYFAKIPNTKDRYLIVNGANWKCLDAVNKDLKSGGRGVQLYRAVDDDVTQVWILEKAK